MVAFDCGSPIRQQIDAALHHAGYEVAAQSRCFTESGECCEVRYELRWHEFGRARASPELADDLARQNGVHRLEWRQAAVD